MHFSAAFSLIQAMVYKKRKLKCIVNGTQVTKKPRLNDHPRRNFVSCTLIVKITVCYEVTRYMVYLRIVFIEWPQC